MESINLTAEFQGSSGISSWTGPQGTTFSFPFLLFRGRVSVSTICLETERAMLEQFAIWAYHAWGEEKIEGFYICVGGCYRFFYEFLPERFATHIDKGEVTNSREEASKEPLRKDDLESSEYLW